MNTKREIKPDRTVTFGELEYENAEQTLKTALAHAEAGLMKLEKRAARERKSSNRVLRITMDRQIQTIAGLKLLLAKITGRAVPNH